ncbi:type II toxin-antitoxin system VapC family toxin [Brevundimonas sp.]|uniref:type II toxin-antitoxin system VapC family toxin n=1 Tax=Brevundimonas sp. TaxID=1871086 RepID=UPI0037C0E453
MIAYPDTSVLVAALTVDDQTERAMRWLRSGPILLTSTWTLAEFSSALALQQRQKRIDAKGASAAEDMLDFIMRAESPKPVLPDDMVEARRVVRELGFLRAPDALHLVICRRLGTAMASLDTKLNEGALAVGVALVDL